MKSGVPQGSALVCVLFTIYIRDIPKPQDHRVFNAIYADDTVKEEKPGSTLNNSRSKEDTQMSPESSRKEDTGRRKSSELTVGGA
ncbi:hypothetical protein Trydic_g17194 [Trypoxylus dichotomus]